MSLVSSGDFCTEPRHLMQVCLAQASLSTSLAQACSIVWVRWCRRLYHGGQVITSHHHEGIGAPERYHMLRAARYELFGKCSEQVSDSGWSQMMGIRDAGRLLVRDCINSRRLRTLLDSFMFVLGSEMYSTSTSHLSGTAGVRLTLLYSRQR